MPPSAAPECERVGWSFEIIATSAPASCASIAARMPAQPAPTTSTSCSPITVGGRYPNPAQRCGGYRCFRKPPAREPDAQVGDRGRFQTVYNIDQGEPSQLVFFARLIEDELKDHRS